MAYGDFKDLARRTASYKVLRDKAFNIAKNQKNDRYQRRLASMAYKFFDKKSKAVYFGFKDNVWGADLADMQLISKFKEGFRSSFCVIDIFSKYARVVPLKGKKGVSVVNAFQKNLKESNRKPNKILVEKGSEFYNNLFKNWLKDNDIEMYSAHFRKIQIQENLLLLRDLLEHYRLKFTNT